MQNPYSPLHVDPQDRLRIKLDDNGSHFIAKFYRAPRFEGGQEGAAGRAADSFARRVPERRKLAWGLWQFAATDSTAMLLSRLWPASQIEATPEAQLTLDYLRTTIAGKEANARCYASFVDNGTVPEHSYTLHPEMPLSAYQQVALCNATRSEGYALFMEQGTGKTPVVIARICNEAERLQSGSLDITTLERSAEQLRAKLRDDLLAAEKRVEAEIAETVKRKRSKLERAAKRHAEYWPVTYAGPASNAVGAAQRAVREAEAWLGQRMHEIHGEMVTLEAEYRGIKEAELSIACDILRADCEHRIRQLSRKTSEGEDRMYRAIIVAPKNVRMNWASEFERFATCQGRVVVLRGGELKRAKLMVEAFTRQPGDKFIVVVCSYDTVRRAWPLLKRVEWDLAVLDESHYIKSPNTKRTKAIMELRERARQRMCLTGTPITNHMLDLYSQFEFLGPGWSGFLSWKDFRSFFGRFERTEAGYERLIGCQNVPLIQERLASQSFIIRKADALPDLPEKVYDIREVEMTPNQAEVYNTLATQLLVELETYMDNAEQEQLAVNHVLTQLLRLAQITSGHVVIPATYTDDGDVDQPRKVLPFTPNPKIDALLEILSEKGPNEKTLVWACWRPDIAAISAALSEASYGHVTYHGGTSDDARQAAEYAYNHDVSTRVFIGNPAAGGTGLNLLGYPPGEVNGHATNTTQVIYFSQNWSPTARSQSEDRAHRRGTRQHVQITDLCVPGTIDEEIRARVLAKRQTADQIADIRELLTTISQGAIDNG